MPANWIVSLSEKGTGRFTRESKKPFVMGIEAMEEKANLMNACYLLQRVTLPCDSGPSL